MLSLLTLIGGPKLVVVVVFDQFRYDYITRFLPFVGEGGFKRMIGRGVFFRNCHHTHVPTFTAPGHATISTGTTPRYHGIVANMWYDRRTGERVYAVSDPSVRTVGGRYRYSSSPKNLLVNTVGDELRLKTGFKGKVISLSLKDRAAILMGGYLANLSIWFSDEDGNFVTSSYYIDSLPSWLKEFNGRKLADSYFHKVWKKIGPKAAYSFTLSGNFPHVSGKNLMRPGRKFYRELKATPFGNELLLELVKAAIKGEELGKDEVPDILFVSFSANDYAGHIYGPYSQEVVDLILRSDRIMAELLRFLDKEIGKEYLVVLTSDHGVAPVPEKISEHGLRAGRIAADSLKTLLQDILSEHFGEGEWVFSVSFPWIYLNDTLLTRRGLLKEARRLAKESLEKVDGIMRVFTADELEYSGFSPWDRSALYVFNGYNPQRSGDLAVIPRAFYLLGRHYSGTNHGTPYTYDTHVPLIFYGFNVAEGVEVEDFCSTTSIAPTIAHILWSEEPAASLGDVLPLRK
ncbi:MAG: alkaline phosphatase family protein [Thermotogae bacterium]|nr:alkaline phosphatase family protein [Thermotogota bacterium]